MSWQFQFLLLSVGEGGGCVFSCASVWPFFFSSSSVKNSRGNMPRIQPMPTPMALPCTWRNGSQQTILAEKWVSDHPHKNKSLQLCRFQKISLLHFSYKQLFLIKLSFFVLSCFIIISLYEIFSCRWNDMKHWVSITPLTCILYVCKSIKMVFSSLPDQLDLLQSAS